MGRNRKIRIIRAMETTIITSRSPDPATAMTREITEITEITVTMATKMTTKGDGPGNPKTSQVFGWSFLMPVIIN
jgi:hypothetical protein